MGDRRACYWQLIMHTSCWHGDWCDHCHPWSLNYIETTNVVTLVVSAGRRHHWQCGYLPGTTTDTSACRILSRYLIFQIPDLVIWIWGLIHLIEYHFFKLNVTPLACVNVQVTLVGFWSHLWPSQVWHLLHKHCFSSIYLCKVLEDLTSIPSSATVSYLTVT